MTIFCQKKNKKKLVRQRKQPYQLFKQNTFTRNDRNFLLYPTVCCQCINVCALLCGSVVLHTIGCILTRVTFCAVVAENFTQSATFVIAPLLPTYGTPGAVVVNFNTTNRGRWLFIKLKWNACKLKKKKCII